MKKLFALLLVACMVVALCACTTTPTTPTGNNNDNPGTPATPASEDVSITLWTYPIGGWGNSDVVNGLIADFEAANPGIKVSVEYLDYTNGDDQVNTAIEGNKAPDLIMEGPERLVANWGAKGLMLDLADLVPAGTYDGIDEDIVWRQPFPGPGLFLLPFPPPPAGHRAAPRSCPARTRPGS